MHDSTSTSFRHFGDLLRWRAAIAPGAPAFRFLDSRGVERGMRSYADLEVAVDALAVQLAAATSPGARVAIMAPPGLSYVTAIFACFRAGVVAVPAYPTRQRRPDPRLSHILAHSGAAHALVAGDGGEGLSLQETGVTPNAPRLAQPPDLALLQYTSGSTAHPKGVMVTHRQLLAHAALLQAVVPQYPGETAVFWIPPYHDMGLMGGILQTVYTGVCAVLMPPAAFLQRPLTWLEAMSRYRAVSSAAPDSAYRECVARARGAGADRALWEALDLSCWRTAINGSEPIYRDTIESFSKEFQATGFKKDAMLPSYGLAEATLYVAGGAVSEGRSGRLSSGRVAPSTVVSIVDPETGCGCADGVEGEIWVQGPQVAAGYWDAPEATDATFGARRADWVDGGVWLRTGDLGLLDGELLVVTGRLKDLLIVRGRNVHPEPLERAAEGAHPAIRRGGTVAVEGEGGEVLLFAELKRGAEPAAAIPAAIHAAVAEAEGVMVDRVVCLPARALPRTSSGKRQRRGTWEAWRAGRLVEIAPRVEPAAGVELVEWICRWIAAERGCGEAEVRPEASLAENGLDSLAVVRLHVALEAELGLSVSQAGMWSAPTVALLAQRIAQPGVAAAIAPSREPFREPSAEPTVGGSLAAEVAAFSVRREALEREGNPFFLAVHPTASPVHVEVSGCRLLSFASYDYLGFAADPRVRAAAAEAALAEGTSASASRLIGGERAVHGALEGALARLCGTPSALVFTSGHATNVSVVSQLVGPGDLVCCDERLHNSGWLGARFSGAELHRFPHNDAEALDRLLTRVRARHRRALVLIEGLYSADGDVAPLADFVAVKQRHDALLMVDDAHGFGVLGATGGGVAEAQGVAPEAVDLWMGTLSKAFASVGGFVAGARDVIEWLRYSCPGFVFSAGMPPQAAAAARMSLELLLQEPQRLTRLRENARTLRELLGDAAGETPILPLMTGDADAAIALSHRLRAAGILAAPMLPPAVAEGASRVRLFLSAMHTREDLEALVGVLRGGASEAG